MQRRFVDRCDTCPGTNQVL